MQTAHWLGVTLHSIGDAVIVTDARSRVTFMNSVAESLTGWTAAEAGGAPLETVFRIVNEATRQTAESPVVKALRDGTVVGLANHTLLIARDGTERPIDDSAAPIRDESGQVAGVVLVFRDISERKRQELALADALAYADNIIATLREPFVVLDKDLRVVSANACFYQTFQASQEQTEGCFVYDLGNGQWDIPQLRALLEELLPQHSAIHDFEVQHDFPTIGSKIMRLNARQFPPEAENPDLILLAIEDVTERTRAADALRASEHRYRTLFESMDEGYCIIEMIFDEHEKPVDYRFLEVNPAFEKQSGMHDATGKRMLEFVSEIETHWLANYGRVALTGEPVRFANEYKTLDRWFDVYAFRVGGPDSRRVAVLFTDFTGHKRAEEKLAESEVRYRRLFESAKDGILILNAETGKIEDANPFMSQLLDYSHEQFLGKELFEIGLFQDVEESKAAFRELQEEHYIRYEDLPLKSEHGEKREVEFISNRYQEDHRTVFQCNIRDITRRKAMERKLEQQAHELADAGRRKDEFLAMLSHELRNPLAPIFNALQLLGLEPDQNKLQREARGVIERQVRHLARLVDDLLEVSRITTGRVRLNLERVEANVLAERAVETVRPMIDRKKQELSVAVCPDHLWLYADPTRLEQAVGNLLTNASKYTEAGGRVWLSVEADGPDAVIRVRDTGDGISPDLLPRIFDLFTQADHSLAHSEGGLGIGLALVKSLVEMHRGSVEAASDGLGRGSEFVVRLPLVAESEAAEDAAPAPPVPAPPAPTTGGLRILVVDDNVDAARMSAMLLRNSGHEVRMAHTGTAALNLALEFGPQAALLDIGLPDMDGYEVARRFRQHPQLQQAVLVALTGYGQDTDRQRARDAGFDHHLVKPVEYATLSKLLGELQRPTN